MSALAMEEAISAAGAAAGEEWRSAALQSVHTCALDKAQFTTDDVWLTGLAEPENDRRAMGAIMRQAAREGWIEATGSFESTVFEVGHQGPRRIWRSLVFGTVV